MGVFVECRSAQIALALSFFSAAISVRAQQIASIDLSHASVRDMAEQPNGRTERYLPEDCKTLQEATGHGYIVATKQAKIAVQVVHVSDMMPTSGSRFWIDVRLRNTGKSAIDVPWSTAGEILPLQDPRHSDYEVGWFGVYMGESELTLSSSLYSSSSAKGSALTVPPGRWITARIGFDLPALLQPYLQLSARWFQAGASYSVTSDCRSFSGSYEAEYQQKNPALILRRRQ